MQAYEVELLIFRNLGGRETPENWGIEAAGSGQRLAIPDDEPSPFSATETPPPPVATATFPALPAAKMKLTAIEDTMRRSRGYQPIAHVGWTQPGFARNAAKYLSVSSLVPSYIRPAGTDRPVARPLSASHIGPGVRRARRRANRHSAIVLRQTRRMRSNERHYIDSPKIGVIAVITPSSSEPAPERSVSRLPG